MTTPAPYTVGTGVYDPGEFQGGTLGLDLTQTGDRNENFATFGCQVPNVDPIETPDWERAKVYFVRRAFTDGIWTFPDGKQVTYWGFEDRLKDKDSKPYPSALIRLREGELAHVKLETRTGPHTIHHHGIEPTTMNDGVGHVSFETSGSYIYQWVPRSPGTWFYHCHRNTVLHFEMGLFGPLIVDPEEGFGYPFRGASERYRYQVEALWVADDIDPRWHTLEHGAGLCGDDVGLNVFRPRYFFVSGVEKTRTAIDSRVAIKAKQGQRILVRLLNASYSVLGVRINGLNADLISVDGHSLVSPDRPWSGAQRIAAGREFHLASAMRHDLLIDASRVGTFTVQFKYYDWVTKRVHNAGDSRYEGSATTRIEIT